jgi:hypothetical protein
LEWTPASRVAGLAKRLREAATADVHVVPSGEAWALQVDGEKRDTFSTHHGNDPREIPG